MNGIILTVLLACQAKKSVVIDPPYTYDVPIQSQSTNETEVADQNRDLAPAFSLYDLNRQLVTLSQYKGSVVLLNFWATWCEPCQLEMPHLESLYKELKERKFVVLAISVDEARTASRVKPISKRNGYTFPILLDPSHKVGDAYNPAKTLPYSVLINAKGEVVWRSESYAPGQEVEIRRRVTEELQKEGF